VTSERWHQQPWSSFGIHIGQWAIDVIMQWWVTRAVNVEYAPQNYQEQTPSQPVNKKEKEIALQYCNIGQCGA